MVPHGGVCEFGGLSKGGSKDSPWRSSTWRGEVAIVTRAFFCSKLGRAMLPDRMVSEQISNHNRNHQQQGGNHEHQQNVNKGTHTTACPDLNESGDSQEALNQRVLARLIRRGPGRCGGPILAR